MMMGFLRKAAFLDPRYKGLSGISDDEKEELIIKELKKISSDPLGK